MAHRRPSGSEPTRFPPTFATLLPTAFPNAELVDGEVAMRTARRIKTPDEVAAMTTALRVAELGIAAAVAELRPGLSEQTLAGAVLEAMAAGGVSTPATQDAAWVTSREHPRRRATGDGQVASGAGPPEAPFLGRRIRRGGGPDLAGRRRRLTGRLISFISGRTSCGTG